MALDAKKESPDARGDSSRCTFPGRRDLEATHEVICTFLKLKEQ
jgi:hypothetical protein